MATSLYSVKLLRLNSALVIRIPVTFRKAELRRMEKASVMFVTLRQRTETIVCTCNNPQLKSSADPADIFLKWS